MRTTRAAIAVAFVAWSLAGCNVVVPSSNASPEQPVAPTASAQANSTLCTALTNVHAERTALGDAFRVAINGDLDEAIAQAHAIRGRLDAILANLPVGISLAKPQADFVEWIQNDAAIVGDAAEILDDPERKLADRDVILAEGRVVLDLTDHVFAMRHPGDAIETACPGLTFSAEPVSFPPPPTNAALGLPDSVGPLTLEPHVGRVDSSLGQVLKSVGVDPGTVREIFVEVSDGTAVHLIEVLEPVDVAASTIAAAVRDVMVPGAKKPISKEIAGFRVVSYRDPGDESNSEHVAVRGRRVVVFDSMPDAVVRDILEAMP